MKELLTRQKSNEKELDKIKVQEVPAGGSSGAPTGAQYLTLATNGDLSAERVLTPGNGLAGTDAGAGSTYTLAVNVDDATIEINSDTLRVKDGGISSTKLADGAVLAEILDDDGSGSGLDADLLDGQHASAFLTAATIGLPCDGRLTLTSGSPVLTSTVTAATTIYFSPYRGNRIALYDGSSDWGLFEFSELSVAVPSQTYRLFDIFAYNNAGTPALETTDWNQSTGAISGATNATPIVITSAGHGLSNGDVVAVAGVGGNTAANGIWSIAGVTTDTFQLAGSTGSGAYTSGGTWYRLNETRATALTTQDGIYVKSGSTTRRYLGTGMTTGTSGQTEFKLETPSNLLLWNYYNQIIERGVVEDTTSHTYTSGGVRVYRNQNTNKIGLVLGVVEDSIMLALNAAYNFDSGDGAVTTGVGLNTTGGYFGSIRVADVFDARYLMFLGFSKPSTGYNFLQLSQQGAATSPDFERGIIYTQLRL